MKSGVKAGSNSIHQQLWWINAWVLSSICKTIKTLPSETLVIYFPSEGQKNDKILFVTVGKDMITFGQVTRQLECLIKSRLYRKKMLSHS